MKKVNKIQCETNKYKTACMLKTIYTFFFRGGGAVFYLPLYAQKRDLDQGSAKLQTILGFVGHI